MLMVCVVAPSPSIIIFIEVRVWPVVVVVVVVVMQDTLYSDVSGARSPSLFSWPVFWLCYIITGDCMVWSYCTCSVCHVRIINLSKSTTSYPTQ